MRKLLTSLVFVLAIVAGIPAPGSAQAREPLLSIHLVTTEIAPGARLVSSSSRS